MALDNYSFFPWMRQGLSAQISEADTLGTPAGSGKRASLNLQLKVSGDNQEKAVVKKKIDLIGPGDITGIERNVIVKTEPAKGITNFQANYFPYVEFYEEDFPWRYTPAGATNNRRLRPWLILMILTKSEFIRLPFRRDLPNPVIEIPASQPGSLWPPPDQTWAWAHVQVNGKQDHQTVGDFLKKNPNSGSSRILCPRRLTEKTDYTAFLLPAFEQGRLAGLGASLSDIQKADRLQSSWEGEQQFLPDCWPVFYEWSFRTDTRGDFESLSELIRPAIAAENTGKLMMDMNDPGYGDYFTFSGELPYEGALVVPPSVTPTFPQLTKTILDSSLPEDKKFVQDLQVLLNLGTVSPASASEEEDDPFVLPPVYGNFYKNSGIREPLNAANNKNWVEQLNLDPAFRAAAGLGAGVIRKNQEELMARAWQQLADAKTANRRLELLRLSKEVSYAAFNKHMGGTQSAESDVRIITYSQPAHRSIRISDTSGNVSGTFNSFRSKMTYVSPGYRRLTRNGGPVARRLQGRMKPDVARPAVSGMATLVATGFFISQPPTPAYLRFNADLFSGFLKGPFREKQFSITRPDWKTFNFFFPVFIVGPVVNPGVLTGAVITTRGQTIYNHFITALDKLKLLFKPAQVISRILQLPGTAALKKQIISRINPEASFNVRFQYILPEGQASLTPANYNPVFDDASYSWLAEQSPELFIPNLDKIPQESFVLLQNNRRFIESYLIGLNHEMAMELLWRGYPVSMNATFFRQFWDVADSISPEKGKDIQPLDKWDVKAPLGFNGKKPTGAGSIKNPVVFVIKATLIKKYPNPVVYAAEAVWERNGRKPGSRIIQPVFHACMDPDYLFVGFDLTPEQVKGSTDKTKHPGYYFIIAERPGELHFGLDVERNGEPVNTADWSELSWSDFPQCKTMIDLNRDIPQVPERKGIAWGRGTQARANEPHSGNGDAAKMAYILFQRPCRVCIHASVMLKA